MTDDRRDALLTLTGEIVAAHVANNALSVTDIPALISSVHASLAGLGGTKVQPAAEQKPAVSIRGSVKPDFIICLEDGQKTRTLKRHLKSAHGLTPMEYRAKWGLPPNYPMVAPAYAEIRRGLAIASGLGTTPRPKKAKGPGRGTKK